MTKLTDEDVIRGQEIYMLLDNYLASLYRSGKIEAKMAHETVSALAKVLGVNLNV